MHPQVKTWSQSYGVCIGRLGWFACRGTSASCRSARGFMLRGPRCLLTRVFTGPCGARSRPPLTGGISTGACTLVVAGALTCACDLAHLRSRSRAGLAYRAIRCASDLDPHPAPTPLNITVSISETRLPYLSRTARIGGRTRAGANFNLMNFPRACPARCSKPGAQHSPGRCQPTGIVRVAPAAGCRPPSPWPLRTPRCGRPGLRGQ